MTKNPYIVTINGRHRVRVFAYDAAGAVNRASVVYEYTSSDPEPCAHVVAEADLRSANLIGNLTGVTLLNGGAR